MSISSYQGNVAKRVAGPNLPVCFPASLEQVSPLHRFKPSTYRYYREFVDYLDSLSLPELKSRQVLEEQEDMVEELLRPLGGYALSDIVLKTIKSELGLKRAIHEYSEDYRMVVDIKYISSVDRAVHSVGVHPLEDDRLMLFSTHVPKKLSGIISVGKLASSLAISEDYPVRDHPLATANFVAIPKD